MVRGAEAGRSQAGQGAAPGVQNIEFVRAVKVAHKTEKTPLQNSQLLDFHFLGLNQTAIIR